MVAPVVEIWADLDENGVNSVGELLVEYASGNVDTDDAFGNAATTSRRGQQFKVDPTLPYCIARVDLWLKKVAGPTDDLMLTISTSTMSAPVYVQSTAVSGASLSTSYGWIRFDLQPYFVVPAAGQYGITIRRDPEVMDAVNYYAIGADLSAPSYADGQAYVLISGVWTTQAADLAFRIYAAQENIAADMRRLRIVRGRSQPWGIAAPGSCEVELKNTAKKYSTGNTASALYGLLQPRTPIEVLYKDNNGAIIARRFRGRMESLEIEVDHQSHSRARMRCLDDLAFLCRDSGPVYTRMTGAAEGNLEAVDVDNAIAAVLDEVGWAASTRTLADSAVVLDTFWTAGEDGLAALNQLCIEELALAYQKGNGVFVFENRAARAGTGSSGTWSDAAGTPYAYRAIAPYQASGQHCFNLAQANAQPRQNDVQYGLAVLPEIVALTALETRDFYLTWDNPATAPLTATAWGTRHLANDAADGSGTDRTGSVTLTESTSGYRKAVRQHIRLVNGLGSTVYITLLQAGYLGRIAVGDGHDVIVEDTASQALYGKRTFPGSPRWIGTVAIAEAWGNAVLSQFSVPVEMAEVSFRPKTVAARDHLCARELSNKVALTNDQLGLAAVAHFIERIEETVQENTYDVTFLLSAA